MKYTINGFITYRKYEWDDKPTIEFSMFDPGTYGSDKVAVREHSFEVEVDDDYDPRPAQIAALMAAKELARAEFSKKVMEIDKRINELLALEMS